MAQVQGSFTVNVKAATPPPNPPVLTPSSGALPQEIEGVPVSDTVAVVSGGTPPYNYDISGLPSGVSAVENDNGDGTATVALTGAPDTGDAIGGDGAGNYTVSITVTDSTPAGTTSKRPLNVRRA